MTQAEPGGGIGVERAAEVSRVNLQHGATLDR